MPSHAIPPGRDGRVHRRLARRRRLLAAWHRLPVMLLPITCLQVAGMPAPQGSAVSLVLGVLRAGLLGGLLAALVFVVVLVLGSRLNARRAPATAPGPAGSISWPPSAGWPSPLASRCSASGLAPGCPLVPARHSVSGLASTAWS